VRLLRDARAVLCNGSVAIWKLEALLKELWAKVGDGMKE
jgi:hypothetical protein